MKKRILKIPKFFCGHSHLRDYEMLNRIVNAERFYSFLVAIGNTEVSNDRANLVKNYDLRIMLTLPKFRFMSTLMLTKNTTEEEINFAAALNIKAIKFLPGNTTTNSNSGISFYALVSYHGYRLINAIDRNNQFLLIHGELNADKNGNIIPEQERTIRALPFIEKIVRDFSGLKIVIEHVNERETINFVKQAGKNVKMTLRPQDAILTKDNVCDEHGTIINPLYYYKPIAKSEADRQAVLDEMLSGSDDCYFGSDSAPHLHKAKLQGAAGVFLPSFVAIPLVIQIFDQNQALDRLQKFTADTGLNFYGLPHINENITVKEENWKIPKFYHNIPIFMGGETLRWKILQ